MAFCPQRYDSIEEQIQKEYGDDIFKELLQQSMESCNDMVRDERGHIVVHNERRELACKILTSCFALKTFDITQYFLAIMILGRCCRSFHHTEPFPPSSKGTTGTWSFVIAIIRLAVKYEGSCGDDKDCGEGPGRNKYGWAYSLHLGPSAGVKEKEWFSFIQMVNMAEKQVLRMLDHDLHWPTPIPFIHELARSEPEEEGLEYTVQTILIILSVHEVFEKYPVHILAAASYSIARKLLHLPPMESILPGFA